MHGFGYQRNSTRPCNFDLTIFPTDSIKSRGVAPLKALIDDIGGWPVVNDDSDSSWVELHRQSTKLGLDIEFPFNFFMIPDYMNNSSRKMIAVSRNNRVGKVMFSIS